MFMKYVKAELYKIFKSKLMLLFLCPLLMDLLDFYMYKENPKYGGFIPWQDFVGGNTQFLNLFVYPLMFGIITSYIFGNEYATKNVNVLFAYPVSRKKLFASKMTAVFIMIFVMTVINFAALLGLGMLMPHEEITESLLAEYGFAVVKMSLMHLVLSMFIAAVSIKAQNIMSGIAAAIVTAGADIVIVNTPLGMFSPWTGTVMLNPKPVECLGRTGINYNVTLIAMIVLLIFSLNSALKNFVYLQKKQKKSSKEKELNIVSQEKEAALGIKEIEKVNDGGRKFNYKKSDSKILGCLRAELYKFFHLPVRNTLLILLLPVVIMALVTFFKPQSATWDYYFGTINVFTNMLVAPVTFGIIASEMFGKDFADKNINVFFTYPVQRRTLMVVKMTALLIIIALSLSSLFLISLGLGNFVLIDALSGEILLTYLIGYLEMIILHFMLALSVCAVCVIFKKSFSGIVFSILAIIGSLLINGGPEASYYPWVAVMQLAPSSEPGLYLNPIASFISIFIVFAVSLAICCKKYKYV